MLTAKLSNGRTVLAKKTKYGVYPKTYANRTQAQKAAAQAGDDWAVVHYGRPFFVAEIVRKS